MKPLRYCWKKITRYSFAIVYSSNSKAATAHQAAALKKNDENFCVNTSQIETAVILLQEITGSNLAIVRSCNSNAMLQNLTRSWWFGSFTKSPDTKTRFVYRIFLMFMSSKSQNMKHL
ncbi:Isocitrate dehydrogenase [NAD] regulatory subunit 3 [Trichinella spiralis]|uniref:Isocitrate dehydrogenase [NAD] regulatory subunit 3 n=1 Tax=Trichinella spiralis TaxID=6334 RepID=A0ABR3KD02_TRISP